MFRSSRKIGKLKEYKYWYDNGRIFVGKANGKENVRYGLAMVKFGSANFICNKMSLNTTIQTDHRSSESGSNLIRN